MKKKIARPSIKFFKMLKFLARECRVVKTLTLANQQTQTALS